MHRRYPLLLLQRGLEAMEPLLKTIVEFIAPGVKPQFRDDGELNPEWVQLRVREMAR
jgi:hypothetical protein